MRVFVTLTALTLTGLLPAACGLLGSGNDAPDIPGKIVFAADDGAGTSQIYTMNANGTGIRQRTHFEQGGDAMQPSWSPDGSRIVFMWKHIIYQRKTVSQRKAKR